MTRIDLSANATSTGRRTPWILAALLAVAACCVLALALMGRSATGSVPLPTTTPAADSAADASGDTADATQSPDAADIPLVTYEVFLARDPFEPVVPDDVQDTGSTPTNPTNPATPTNPTNPATPVQPVGPAVPSPTDPRCSGQEEVVCDGRVVTLLDIITANGDFVAVIQVDTTVYEVGEGQRFATNFELRAIDPPTVSVIFGDETFVLRSGDSVLK